MEDNDIGPSLTSRVACWFEDFIATYDEDAPTPRRGWFRRKSDADEVAGAMIRRHRPNEMPLKSLIHLVNKLGIKVDVYTYYDEDYVEAIEYWLARKGVACTVYSFQSLEDLRDDFKYNREVQTLYTPYEEDASYLFPRATVVTPEQSWGF